MRVDRPRTPPIEPLYTAEQRIRRDRSPWTLVQGVLAPVQFLVFLVSLALVLRFLLTGNGQYAATISVVIKTFALTSLPFRSSNDERIKPWSSACHVASNGRNRPRPRTQFGVAVVSSSIPRSSPKIPWTARPASIPRLSRASAIRGTQDLAKTPSNIRDDRKVGESSGESWASYRSTFKVQSRARVLSTI